MKCDCFLCRYKFIILFFMINAVSYYNYKIDKAYWELPIIMLSLIVMSVKGG